MKTKFIYTGILVKNLDRAIKFYTNELGMRVLFRSKIKETGGEVAWLRTPGSGQTLELNWYPRPKWYGPDKLDHLAFQVDNADQVYRRLVKRGAKSAMKPFDEGSWRLGYVKDPDGAWVEICSKKKKRRS